MHRPNTQNRHLVASLALKTVFTSSTGTVEVAVTYVPA